MNSFSHPSELANLDSALAESIESLFDGSITREEHARLERHLAGDAGARREFVEHLRLHAAIFWDADNLCDTPDDSPSIPAGVFGRAVHGAVGYFSQELPLSMLVASLIMALVLYAAWMFNITHYQQVVDRATPSGVGPIDPALAHVGRVSGMKDCHWADPESETLVGASVPLGREYALASGLMEITYRSGARVILEGPCVYKVESSAGGLLERGKLTANISGQKSEARGQRSENSSLIPHPSSFVVTTPTVIVTDLGTEFGVEVDENGDTVSFVFQGSIKVQGLAALAASSATHKETILRKNESIRVSRVRETHRESNANEQVRFTHPTETPKFVRRLHEPPKLIDLLDIVAGGNGVGKRRESGIDPTTGMEDPVFSHDLRANPGVYRSVNWNRFIDGVFMPDGNVGPVQVDSAGNIFEECPKTQGLGWGSIWSRAADIKQPKLAEDTQYWAYAMGRGEKYMPQKRGLLCLNSNVGITFDLDALRKTHSEISVVSFQATCGMVDASFRNPNSTSLADVWVLVDGKPKFKRLKLTPNDGTFEINVELASGDSFLTLVVTDGGNKHSRDWVVMGDPILQAVPVDLMSDGGGVPPAELPPQR